MRIARRLLLVALSLTALSVFAQPSSTNNNDSCDIAATPAATLLLPYFEVDTGAAVGTGANTLFTITNVSPYPQIAHVTLWTDWAYPVLTFNLFLTGYDVQGISLYDVIVGGVVPPTGIATPAGTTAFPNIANPNFVADGELAAAATCADLPGSLPADLVTAVRTALTDGVGFSAGGVSCPGRIGGFGHGKRAIGYLTIDVVSTCSARLATDADGAYFLGRTAPLLFDNVLLGDYQQLGTSPGVNFSVAGFDADSSPMVHVRAVPAGGLSGAGGAPGYMATNLPFTFYDRYTPRFLRTADRRQPLPSTFAARWIENTSRPFATDFKIWREGVTAGLPTCSESGSVQRNSAMDITWMIRFDEHENGVDPFPRLICGECAPRGYPLPAAVRISSSTSPLPTIFTTDLGGWMFFNLSSGSKHMAYDPVCDPVLSAQRPGFASGPCGTGALGEGGSRTTTQNWVISSMFGPVGSNRLSVDFDAAWLGNGCTPAPAGGARVAPGSEVTP